ncbi:hypothetical protein ABZX39_35100 [Streptomyces collinus]|uniref:hypothetical protein n=1 Tax=Streptomyces collinus TaxID=42684 RepID=UPI0033B37B61
MPVVSYGPDRRVYLPAPRAGRLTQASAHRAVPPDRAQRLPSPFAMAGVRPLGLRAAVPGLTSLPRTRPRRGRVHDRADRLRARSAAAP